MATAKTFNIQIYDTRDRELYAALNVPATTWQDACKKLAERKGYYWIGEVHGACYVIDAAVYCEYNKLNHLSADELAPCLESEEKSVLAGEQIDQGFQGFQGLYELYEVGQEIETWSE